MVYLLANFPVCAYAIGKGDGQHSTPSGSSQDLFYVGERILSYFVVLPLFCKRQCNDTHALMHSALQMLHFQMSVQLRM